jgi:hypothetical protein
VKRSRRRFLGLIATGSAAAAATPVAALARVVEPKKKPARPAPGAPAARPAGPRDGTDLPSAVVEEIRRQKAGVEQSLEALRGVPLPPGSEPSFVFAPLGRRKKTGAP